MTFAQKIGLKSAIPTFISSPHAKTTARGGPALSVVIERELHASAPPGICARPIGAIWPELVGAEGAPEVQAVEAKVA